MAPAYTFPPFRMTLLDGWVDQTVFIIRGPEEDGVEHILTIQIDPKLGRTAIEKYGEKMAEATLASLTNAELLKSGPVTLPGGLAAYELVFKWLPMEDQVIFRRQLYVERKKHAFIVSGSFSEQTLEAFSPQMDTMAATLNMYGE